MDPVAELNEARKTLAESIKNDVPRDVRDAIGRAASEMCEARAILAGKIVALDDLLRKAGLIG